MACNIQSGMDRVTPKSLLLDLLRVTPLPVPVRQLVAIGELFGLEGNAVRVALTRLVARGLLTADGRGSYRLAAVADPVSRWADGWRLGERRLKPWTGAWLCLWHPRGGGRAARARSHRALGRLGFGEGREGLWVRPDNLRASLPVLHAELGRLGLAEGALLFVGQELPDQAAAGWTGLWPSDRIAGEHRRALRAIERSRLRLPRLAGGPALVESFLVGGGAIRSLVHDPLLPDRIAAGDDRRALTEAMLDYYRRGFAVWNDMINLTAVDRIPSHTSAIRAAS
jgi:phenylacetic acid degradation operon negative regulatory protein